MGYDPLVVVLLRNLGQTSGLKVRPILFKHQDTKDHKDH